MSTLERLWDFTAAKWKGLSSPTKKIAALFFALGGGIGLSVGWSVARQYDEREIRALNQQLSALGPPPTPDYNLELRCVPAFLPQIQSNELIDVLGLDAVNPPGLRQVFGLKADDGQLPTRYRCDLTSLGNVPVVNLWLDVDFAFRQVDKETAAQDSCPRTSSKGCSATSATMSCSSCISTAWPT